ncbi:DUF1028 domain-containing protein [Pseudoclavibacter sp. 13-3]|uniref:DUF1028 domain-containing protein n=1 Tax=Pseudoclavibacter sp. 13-3 TaxID=2901228 RepID=UPI001E5483CB|nr:DUF1028 domain-containing protein [Pseudoclavibacter sp. 13-3]MCD7101245.1 DUF1028 domain-containing protein [Pseudoclavibacter sp. 13-3]
MTFSLAARDPRTGRFGLVVSSSSPAVAARCVNLRAGVGAVSSQNVTNPGLGSLALDLLEKGLAPDEVIAGLRDADEHIEYRQVTVLDAQGRSAVFNGEGTLGVHAFAQGPGAVAAGNMLADPGVPQAMVDGFLASTADEFEQRLLDGITAGLALGGEAGPVRSAGLSVIDDRPWRLTDLRVDDADAPLTELQRLLTLWLPQRDQYALRALHPDAAPSYGVPGDE